MALRPRHSVVWRRARKPAVADNNAEANGQYFQVGVTVLEARRVAWSSARSRRCFMILGLGSTRLRSRLVRNMAEPRFREYFDFDLCIDEQGLQKLVLSIAFMELKYCAPPQILGEAVIPLRDIWIQPGHHQQKWHQLTSARQPDLGPVGLINLDISIGNLHEVPSYTALTRSSNITVGANSESQRAMYIISIYQAFGLMKQVRKGTKAPSTFIRVSFCNLTGKTDVQQRTHNPVYNERISLVDIFPSQCPRVTFEVYDEGRFNVLASSRLELSHISHEEDNGFVPTFGPSLLQFYSQTNCKCKKRNLKEGGPFYCGALLVSLETIVPYMKRTGLSDRRTCVEPLQPLNLDSVWQLEEFCLFCSLFEVSLLNWKPGKDSGIAITMEELPGFDSKSSEGDLKLHYTGAIPPTSVDKTCNFGVIYFGNEFPVLQLAVSLPDFRFRKFRKNVIQRLIDELENIISIVDRHLNQLPKKEEIAELMNEALDSAATVIIRSIEVLGSCNGGNRSTQETTLDQKQLELLMQELRKVYGILSEQPRINSPSCPLETIKPQVTKMMVELKDIYASLQKVFFKSPDGWPDIIVWLLDSGSRIAYAKISARDILYSTVPQHCGKNCGKVITLYMKSINCGQAVGCFDECQRLPAKVELMLWLGAHQQTSCLAASIPAGYSFKFDKKRMFLETTACVIECRVFIYKAYLANPAADTVTFVRIYALGLVKETLPQESRNPIWDQTLRIATVMYLSLDKLSKYPPEVLIEVYARSCKASTKSADLIGRATIKSVVDLSSEGLIAPRLKSLDLHNMHTDECKGQIMVAAQTVETIQYPLKKTFDQALEGSPRNALFEPRRSCDHTTEAILQQSKTAENIASNQPKTASNPRKINNAREKVANSFLYHANETGIYQQNKQSAPHNDVLSHEISEMIANDPRRFPIRDVTYFTSYQRGNHKTDITTCQKPTESTSPDKTLSKYQNAVDVVERLPPYLIPQISTYKVDIIWWGLRDIENSNKKYCAVIEIDNQIIKSDIIHSETPNCNFPNTRIMTQSIKTSFDQEFSASVSFTLYSSSSFGRTVFYGFNNVKNSKKFLIDWVPKSQRENSLKTVPLIQPSDLVSIVVSSNVYPYCYTKKYTQNKDEVFSGNSVESESIDKSVVKEVIETQHQYAPIRQFTNSRDKKWYQRFYDRDTDEEELLLLPTNAQEKNYHHISETEENKYKTEILNMETENMSKYSEADWWTRYFISEERFLKESRTAKQTNIDKMEPNIITIYHKELEAQPQFSKFKDWCHSIKLYKSQKTGVPNRDKELCCGILKAGVAIYKWPPSGRMVAVSQSGADLSKSYFEDHPASAPSKFLIRIYVVKGVDLMTNEADLPSTYVIIKCGNKRLGERDSFVLRTANPVFARVYEFNCKLPEDYLATVSIFNHDQSNLDALIGETNIDVENRVYSKHRACIGLVSEYKVSGPKKWRDPLKPSSILEEICYKNHITPPIFPDDKGVILNSVEYRIEDSEIKSFSKEEQRENICLQLLHQWHRVPGCGCHIVPEHIETRCLYNPENPGIPQGKLQMWMEIFPFPLNGKIPPPVDITPPRAEEYELRLTVRALSGLKTQQSPDVYVTAWVGNQDAAQVTDVYDTVGGSGALPWMMLFKFKYQTAQKKILLEQKGVFTEFSESLNPLLELRVVNCNGAPYTYMGVLTMNLHSMKRPAGLPSQSALNLAQSKGRIDLFHAGSSRGWWPLVDDNLSYAGAVELDLHLSSKNRNNQLAHIERIKMRASSCNNYRSEISIAQEISPATNSVTTFIANLSRRTLRIIIGFMVICVVYYLQPM